MEIEALHSYENVNVLFFAFTSKSEKSAPAAVRGRASKRGQESVETVVVEEKASSPSKRRGRSLEADIPSKKITPAGTFVINCH